MIDPTRRKEIFWAEDLLMQRDALLAAIREYQEATIACESCSAMLLSDGVDPEPARLMQKLEKARFNLFKKAEEMK